MNNERETIRHRVDPAAKQVAQVLANHYGKLSVQGIDLLAAILKPMKFLKGDEILKEGETSRYIYYIKEGLVRQHYIKNGKDMTEHIACSDNIFMCIESMFRQEPTKLAVEALEPCKIYGIDFLKLQELCALRYEFCSILFAIMQESMILLQTKADTIRFESALNRYKRTLKDIPDIVHRAPLHIIASFLQMTPETLSRTRSQVRKEG